MSAEDTFIQTLMAQAPAIAILIYFLNQKIDKIADKLDKLAESLSK